MQMEKPTNDILTDLISTYQEELSAFIKPRVEIQSDAEDLLQEVWFQLSKTLSQSEITNGCG